MVKKFIGWIFDKIYIDTRERGIEIKESEVYWCSIGENIGDEENGKGENFRRPVLIFKKFNNKIFWGIPMSSKIKENPYYAKVLLKGIYRSVMLSQLRLFDTKRLHEKIGYISNEDMLSVKESVIRIIHGNIR